MPPKKETKQVFDKNELPPVDAQAWQEKADETTSLEQWEKAWALRAEQLAQSADQTEIGEQVEMVVVQVGREQFGLDVSSVYEIRPMQALTRVPHVPVWVSGVVNLRGRIMSVVDLGLYLGLTTTEQEESPLTQLVVVETPGMELALKVDNVLGVESIPINRIQEITASVNGIRMEYVRGLLMHEANENKMLTLLEMSSLLADPRLIIHQEIT